MTLSIRDALVYVFVEGYEHSSEFCFEASKAVEEVHRLRTSVGLAQSFRSHPYINRELNKWVTHNILAKNEEVYHLTALGKQKLSGISRKSPCFTKELRRSPRPSRRDDRREYANSLRSVKKDARSFHKLLMPDSIDQGPENAEEPIPQTQDPEELILQPQATNLVPPNGGDNSIDMDMDITLVDDPDMTKFVEADIHTDVGLLDAIYLNDKGKGKAPDQSTQPQNTPTIAVTNEVSAENAFGIRSFFPPQEDIEAHLRKLRTPSRSPFSLPSTPNAPGPSRRSHIRRPTNASEGQSSPTPIRTRALSSSALSLTLQDEETDDSEPSSPSLTSSTFPEVSTPIQLEHDDNAFIVGEHESEEELDAEIDDLLNNYNDPYPDPDPINLNSLPSSPSYTYTHSNRLRELALSLDQVTEERDRALEALDLVKEERDTAIRERNSAYRFIESMFDRARRHVPNAFSQFY